MYRIGQATQTGMTQHLAGYAWALPTVGAFVGDFVMTGRLRPWLIFPHYEWKVQRKGQIGLIVGGTIGLVAAALIARKSLQETI